MSPKAVERTGILRATFAASLREDETFGKIGYVYGYPHKKAYRPLARPRSLAEVWDGERRDALFCYVHVPFCNQRCSFCNLFTDGWVTHDAPRPCPKDTCNCYVGHMHIVELGFRSIYGENLAVRIPRDYEPDVRARGAVSLAGASGWSEEVLDD
jgi:hypothetical protein